MKPGRRAFLLPGLFAPDSWSAFMQRLTRLAPESVVDETPGPAKPGRATLRVRRDEDVVHARALCAQYGVLMQLPGADDAQCPAERPRLRLDDGAQDAIEHWDPASGVAVLRGGCTLASLRHEAERSGWHGLRGDDGVSVAQWLAGSRDWPVGCLALSNVVWAEVVLAGGGFERLGPFGVADVQPLRSAAGRSLISGLFETAATVDMASFADGSSWPGAYRLDALAPRPSGDGQAPSPNPAHLLLGSKGTLAWISRVQLQLTPADHEVPVVPASSEQPLRRAPPLAIELADDRIKQLFDPSGSFPGPVV